MRIYRTPFAALAFLLACTSGQTGDAGLGVEGKGGKGNEPEPEPASEPTPGPEGDDDATGCDPYACDCGIGQVSSGGNGAPSTCVGTPLCTEDDECPPARSGSAEPICASFGDQVINGFTGSCRLPCTETSECPDDMQCVGSNCATVTGSGAAPQGGVTPIGTAVPAGMATSSPVPSDPGDVMDPTSDAGDTSSGGAPTESDAGNDAGSGPLASEDAGAAVSIDAAAPGELCEGFATTEECVADACAACEEGEVCVTHWVASLTDVTCEPNPCGGDALSTDPGSASSECSACAVELCGSAGCQSDDTTVSCIRRCNAPNTPIVTPQGERAIESLEEGDLVYSVHQGTLQVVPITAVRRLPVVNHHVVRIVLAGGTTLEISPSHPTADGRTVGDLSRGDLLDTTEIVTAELVPYEHAFTYDLLPQSDTGTYLAGGVLMGSTLFRGSVWVPR